MFGLNGVKFKQIIRTDTDTVLRNSTQTMYRFLPQELTLHSSKRSHVTTALQYLHKLPDFQFLNDIVQQSDQQP
jgi:hypothetical protein